MSEHELSKASESSGCSFFFEKRAEKTRTHIAWESAHSAFNMAAICTILHADVVEIQAHLQHQPCDEN